MKILGIETSCDETAIAVVESKGTFDNLSFELLGSAVHSQIDMHREYGGVYPNLAKREHIKNLPIVLEDVLNKTNLKIEEINLIAVTVGPGLEPALWTGITFAKELSEKYNLPLIPTNHMFGHLVSVLLKKEEKVEFPAIGLLISGNHTELVLLNNWTEKNLLGQTKDDAIGEAFDKVARMMGLPYPGGPEISKLAEEAREIDLHLDTPFPRPMIHSKDYDFSFSGLKTAVLYYIKKHEPLTSTPSPIGIKGADWLSDSLKKKIAREFEDSVTEVLVSKSKKMVEEYGPKSFIIGGGVIANNHIRKTFEKLFEQNYPDTALLIPEKSLTTDNATMIAMAGYLTHLSGTHLDLKAQGNLKIG